MTGQKEIYHCGTDEVVCPYCGYEYSDSWTFNEDGVQQGEEQCAECGEKFMFETEYSASYITAKIPEVKL